MNKKMRTVCWIGIVVLAGAAWLGRPDLSAPDAKGANEAETAAAASPVAVTPAARMSFAEVVEISGNVASKNFALVSARIPGTIDEIFVEEGDRVTAGKSKLFQTDRLKVRQAAEIAKQNVSVAEAGLRASQATVKRVAADFDKAKIDYERFQRLYHQDGAVTLNALETQESRFKQLSAALEEARAADALSESRLVQARSNLAIANKDLSDSRVLAPIDGFVSARLREPGEMAGAGTPVLRIDDTSVLEVSAYLPAEYYARVAAGATTMKVTVGGIDAGELPVIYKSPTIDSRLRNFEIKAVLTDPPGGITAGALAGIAVTLDRHEGVGVPRDAVIRKADGMVLFTAEGGKARRVVVETGLETGGFIEITDGGVTAGQSVVSMGQDRLTDGAAVTVTGEGAD